MTTTNRAPREGRRPPARTSSGDRGRARRRTRRARERTPPPSRSRTSGRRGSRARGGGVPLGWSARAGLCARRSGAEKSHVTRHLARAARPVGTGNAGATHRRARATLPTPSRTPSRPRAMTTAASHAARATPGARASPDRARRARRPPPRVPRHPWGLPRRRSARTRRARRGASVRRGPRGGAARLHRGFRRDHRRLRRRPRSEGRARAVPGVRAEGGGGVHLLRGNGQARSPGEDHEARPRGRQRPGPDAEEPVGVHGVQRSGNDPMQDVQRHGVRHQVDSPRRRGRGGGASAATLRR